MNIYILPKYKCLEIAKKSYRKQYQSDEDLLHYLPDDMFNRTLVVKREYGDCYEVDGVVSCFWRIPKGCGWPGKSPEPAGPKQSHPPLPPLGD